MSKCVIYCADNMVVGRWYKIISYLTEPNETNNNIAPYNVTYKCNNSEIAFLIHDTIYIKKSGSFIITANDMYGNLSQKTINAIKEPKIQRNGCTLKNLQSWDDLKTRIEQAGENKYITIPNGEYNFDLNENGITVPKGTIIDFNKSIINITSSVETYTGFIFYYDYSGLKNATFNGINMKNDYSYSDQCTLVKIICGDYQKIENLTFNDVAGFNIAIGTWPLWYSFQPTPESGRWIEENNYNGYIEENGEIISNLNSWTMQKMEEIITTDDRSFCVGQSNMWLPGKTYDLAFYDENENFIELNKSLMFYRRYYYPENAKYFRLCIYQEQEPTNSSGRDDICIMRMMGGINGINRFTTVCELLLNNIICKNHASGGLSIVGACQDIHINKMQAIGEGWKNAWAFDIEDSWNSSIGVVVSHSYFGNGTVVFNGTQGFSILSTIMGSTNFRSLIQAPTIINSLCSSINVERLRNNLTIINSYPGNIQKQENYEYIYTFNNLEQQEANDMRSKIASLLN